MTDTLTEVRDEDIDIALLSDIPLEFVKSNFILPIKILNNEIFIAVADENGIFAANDIAKKYKLTPKILEVSRGLILNLINKSYGTLSSANEVMGNISKEDFLSVATEFESPKDILEIAQEAPIIKLLNAILQEAVNRASSDIHIEPFEKDLDVRIRIDGIMKKLLSPPKIIQEALISRIKIIANLDISEKRLPQDGRIRLLVAGKDIDIRVSVIPSIHGERVVLRLLNRKSGLKDLNEVGLNRNDQTKIENILSHTHGILLVTGPTGSGKTTTLYAALNKLKSEKINIITIEDPVEYELPGIAQMNINNDIGLTFASGLRTILRQDPDVIMIGEIRDRETAEIAIQASLTGHLVLSTLHTNDAPSAITRLLDLRIEPFLISSSLLGVLAQRLVRKICPYCKTTYSLSEKDSQYFKGHSIKNLYIGKGCDKCMKEGYIGRSGIFELLLIDESIRTLISKNINSQEIRASAILNSMQTLFQDGINKIVQGETTLEEVLRVTQKDYFYI